MPDPEPEMLYADTIPVVIDERVPLWWNGGVLLVPAGVDPEPLLERLAEVSADG